MVVTAVEAYDVRPRTIWIGDQSAKGYLWEELKEALKRYVPRSEIRALRDSVAKKRPQEGAETGARN